MDLSALDLFKVGLGPSSSHSVGPMKAALAFARSLSEDELLGLGRVQVELFGSLALTGKGHGTDRAIMLGLSGQAPDSIDPDVVDGMIAAIRADGAISMLGWHKVPFDEAADMVFHRRDRLPGHTNGMRFTAYDQAGAVVRSSVMYSIGGGFVLDEAAMAQNAAGPAAGPAGAARAVRYPFASGADLLRIARANSLPISGIVRANERAWRPAEQTHAALLHIWSVMQTCIRRGCETGGTLPGGLNVPRRAPGLFARLSALDPSDLSDPLRAIDWVTLAALAVNEENAAGGRVVTAPTNGAAGIVPAVLYYYMRFVRGADDEGVVRFLLTSAAIGFLFKTNASISGAEVGCQGEVGVACSMAAAGLAEVLGGTPEQVENAAEIGMEHNLGLTCDPVGGLVQVPCIERNAIAASKAINAARLALHGSGRHIVSLDKVIRTMRLTGADMKRKYKETSLGGLAAQIPVSLADC